jgi:hypothetical protein
LLIEALLPLRLRLPAGYLELEPGVPVELPDHLAQRLLKKAVDKVRVVHNDVIIEPASPKGRFVYWETADCRILGPACPEFLAQVGTGLKSTDFWVIVEFKGQPRWVRSDRLRSKKAFLDTAANVHKDDLPQ